MKRTKIKYRYITDGDLFEIESVENASTASEIFEQYFEKQSSFYNSYCNAKFSYFGTKNEDGLSLNLYKSSKVCARIYKGHILNRKEFEQAMQHLKSAGRCLEKTRKEFDAWKTYQEVREVLI